MTTEVVAVAEATPLREALSLLVCNLITAMPVLTDTGAIVGIVSEADLLRQTVSVDADPGQSQVCPVGPLTVADVMRRRPITITPESDLSAATDLMTCTPIKSLPVVEDGRVVGVVSRSDLVRHLAEES